MSRFHQRPHTPRTKLLGRRHAPIGTWRDWVAVAAAVAALLAVWKTLLAGW